MVEKWHSKSVAFFGKFLAPQWEWGSFTILQGRNKVCGIEDQRVGSRIAREGSGITALGSGITSHGIGISSFLGDQGTGYSIFVGSGTKICHSLESRIRNLGTKMGSAMKRHVPRTFVRDCAVPESIHTPPTQGH